MAAMVRRDLGRFQRDREDHFDLAGAARELRAAAAELESVLAELRGFPASARAEIVAARDELERLLREPASG